MRVGEHLRTRRNAARAPRHELHLQLEHRRGATRGGRRDHALRGGVRRPQGARSRPQRCPRRWRCPEQRSQPSMGKTPSRSFTFLLALRERPPRRVGAQPTLGGWRRQRMASAPISVLPDPRAHRAKPRRQPLPVRNRRGPLREPRPRRAAATRLHERSTASTRAGAKGSRRWATPSRWLAASSACRSTSGQTRSSQGARPRAQAPLGGPNAKEAAEDTDLAAKIAIRAKFVYGNGVER